MTGPKGNSEVCLPETLRGTLRVKGKQSSLFPVGPVIKCFVIPQNSKIEHITYGCHLTTLLQNLESFRLNFALCKSLSTFSLHGGWPCQ